MVLKQKIATNKRHAMGETIPLFSTTFNRSVRVESRPDKLTSESGALLQRELMERTRIIKWLDDRLSDTRDPSRIQYPLADLFRCYLMLLGQSWRDADDADKLRFDSAFRVASSSLRGDQPLSDDNVFASQPTLSRLLEQLSRDENRQVIHEAIIELASRRYKSSIKGNVKRL